MDLKDIVGNTSIALNWLSLSDEYMYAIENGKLTYEHVLTVATATLNELIAVWENLVETYSSSLPYKQRCAIGYMWRTIKNIEKYEGSIPRLAYLAKWAHDELAIYTPDILLISV